jgi:hypothetical protein
MATSSTTSVCCAKETNWNRCERVQSRRQSCPRQSHSAWARWVLDVPTLWGWEVCPRVLERKSRPSGSISVQSFLGTDVGMAYL